MNKISFLNYRASVNLDNLEAHNKDLKQGQKPRSFQSVPVTTVKQTRVASIAAEVKQLFHEETTRWSRAKKKL